jgi:aquaporin Z
VAALRRYLVELLATFFLALTVLGAAAQEVVVGAVAVGAVVTVAVGCGAHANPVLTLAAVLARRLPGGELLPCWAAQLVGALVGAALARWLVDAPAVSPLQDQALLSLLVAQLLFAAALCYVVLQGDRPGGWSDGAWGAAAAGLVVVGSAAVLDPVAAAAFNPAAAFAEVVAGIAGWATIWVYVVGCPIGAVLAGLLARQASSRPG